MNLVSGIYAGQCTILELVTGGAPLPRVLEAIVELIEEQAPERRARWLKGAQLGWVAMSSTMTRWR